MDTMPPPFNPNTLVLEKVRILDEMQTELEKVEASLLRVEAGFRAKLSEVEQERNAYRVALDVIARAPFKCGEYQVCRRIARKALKFDFSPRVDHDDV